MGVKLHENLLFFINLLGTAALLGLWLYRASPFDCVHEKAVYQNDETGRELAKDAVAHKYKINDTFIVIVGLPHSGKTLMRVLLDSHPDVHCAEDMQIISDFVETKKSMAESDVEGPRLEEAGVFKIFDEALSTLLMQLIVRSGHGGLTNRLCLAIKESTAFSFDVMHNMLPNAKFIMMARDGRASSLSGFYTDVPNAAFIFQNFYYKAIGIWNTNAEKMHAACLKLGEKWCKVVKYEHLVLHPRKTLGDVLNFAGLNWSERVMSHHKYIDNKNGVYVSKLEPTYKMLVAPINLHSLNKWVDILPKDFDHDSKAPMLKKLGYDTRATYIPTEEADEEVKRNTEIVHLD